MSQPVRYRLAIAEPHTHLVEVEVVFPPAPGQRRDLSLPVWTPGSYLVRDFARHVSGLEARDGRGRRLAVTKVAKSTWRVEGVRGALRVSYQVYAHERSVRTSHVTAGHAFLSPPTLLLFSPPLRGRPCAVTVKAPRGFRVVCPLPGRNGRFLARDYDELVDSPIECGRHREIGFAAAATPFRLVLCGRGNPEPGKLKRDLGKVAQAAHQLFGSFPFDAYLTILHLTPAGRGGLEHQASTALEWPRFRFRSEEGYQDFLALFAHELFHAWNVKTAAPRAFRPHNYLRETPTRLLWWFEGVTDYYALLLLRRAGLLSPPAYLERLLGRHERLARSPGRKEMSVAEASYDAWIKFYRPDENTTNSSVSYYEKGHLVGALLDLEIRRRTGGGKSLDDVIRRVVRRGVRGVPEDGVLPAVDAVAGSDFSGWFERYVSGTDDLPFARLLGTVGLAVQPKEGERRGGWLGVTTKSAGGRLSLASVVAGGPAEQAGLSAFDELLALDGDRIDEESLAERLLERQPGTRVRLSFFRDDRLHEADVRLGEAPRAERVVARARPTAAERARLAGWIQARHEDLAEPKPATADAAKAAPGPRAAARRRPAGATGRGSSKLLRG